MNEQQRFRVVNDLLNDESNFEYKKNLGKKNFLQKILMTTTLIVGINIEANNYTNELIEFIAKEKTEFTHNNYNQAAVLNRINKETIPVIMLHKIGMPEDRYTINQNNFRKILELIHKKNYHLVSLKEFKEGNFLEVPVGKKPLLLTFDDAGEGQFYLTHNNIPNPNSAVGIMEEFKTNNPGFSSKAVFFISYSDDKQNFREPFIEKDLSEKKIKYLFENGYDVGWHTPFHTNNINSSKKNIDEQTIILDALIFKSLGEKNYNKIIRSFAHPFGAKPKDESVLNYLFSKYDLVFDAWGGNSFHPLSEKFNKKAINRIETHMNNIESILNNKNNYEVTKEDSIFYDRKFNKNINIEPRGIDNSNWDYFLNNSKLSGEL